jgi:crossover junction endodeoxyribonuclease RusA
MTFIVFGQPATKGSSVSFMGANGVVTKADCKNLAAWSQAAGWAARAAQVRMAAAGTAIAIWVTFQFVRPKSQAKRVYPTVKPDTDKLGRALLDALTGVAYADDAQVVWLRIRKVYGVDARTTVRVEEMA